MSRLALATYSGLPDLYPDDAIAQEALRQAGHTVDATIWDAPEVEWARYDAILIRSCWDYHTRLGEFLDWLSRLERVGVPVWNPPDVVRWNVRKTYLNDLAAMGVKTPRSVFMGAGNARALGSILQDEGFAEAVVKPIVSAGSYETWRTSPMAAAADQGRFASLLASASDGVIVQELVPEILSFGEVSLVYFLGEFSHAVLKRAAPGDFRVQEEFGGTPTAWIPPDDLVAAGRRALNAAPIADMSCLYARVDGAVVDEELVVMELELVEPALYFGFGNGAKDRFASALASVLGPKARREETS